MTHVPLGTLPAWLTPGRITVGSIALAGGMLGTGAVGYFGVFGALCVGGSTALISGVLGYLVLSRARRREEVVRWSLVGGLFAGVLSTPLSMLPPLIFLVEPPHPVLDVLAGLVVATVFGSVAAGPLGLLFGRFYLVPLREAFAATEVAALDGVERQLALCGGWLALAALVSSAVLLVWTTWDSVVFAEAGIIVGAFISVGVLGLVAASVGLVRLRSGRAWLARVRLGEVSSYEVRAIDEISLDSGRLPLLTRDAVAGDAVLVRLLGPGGPAGAYRTGVDVVPIARVDALSCR